MKVKNNNAKRIGFHSIESIISFNPQKIKKLFIPYAREDKRIQALISLAEKNGINFEVSVLEMSKQAHLLWVCLCSFDISVGSRGVT